MEPTTNECVCTYMCACVHVCMCACVHVCMCACRGTDCMEVHMENTTSSPAFQCIISWKDGYGMFHGHTFMRIGVTVSAGR